MILKSLGCSSRLAIGLCFSGLIFLSGCSDSGKPSTPSPDQPIGPSMGQSMGQSIPPIGSGDPGTAPQSMNVNVDLSAISDQVASDAKVFIFIRAAGERMPLGVEHFTVATLPASVSFMATDNHGPVTVFARVSPSGKVEKSSGDFETSALAEFSHPAREVILSFSTTAQNGSQASAASNSMPTSMAAATAGTAATTAHSGSQPGASAIDISIELDVPQVELEKFPATTRLFVIAKTSNNPMPLAVKVFPVTAVPSKVQLTNADAMMPTRTLSSASEIIVSGRISLSGDVSRDRGDWEGTADTPTADAPNQYALRIDKQVE